MNAADRQEIIDAADAARWAYAKNQPETGDRHIERIKALAAAPEPVRRFAMHVNGHGGMGTKMVPEDAPAPMPVHVPMEALAPSDTQGEP